MKTAFLRLFVLLAVLQVRSLAASSHTWLAFRYSPTEVLSYLCDSTDARRPSEIDLKATLPDPVAKWGQGGYLLPAPPSLSGTGSCMDVFSLPKAQQVSIRLRPAKSVTATVTSRVEQWGMENPHVRVGVIAAVDPADLRVFREEHSDYFVAFSGAEPDIQVQAVSVDSGLHGDTLNDLGDLGRIILDKRDAGWTVALVKGSRRGIKATQLVYHYGD